MNEPRNVLLLKSAQNHGNFFHKILNSDEKGILNSPMDRRAAADSGGIYRNVYNIHSATVYSRTITIGIICIYWLLGFHF